MSAVAKPRVVIIGAGGVIGNVLWKAWEEEGQYELTLVDKRTITGARSRTEIGDVCDPDFAAKVFGNQDVLVHLVLIQPDNVGPRTTELTDIGLCMRLWETAREAGIGKIVYASSNRVTMQNEHLGGPPVFSTADQYNPCGWYGAMKGMAEIGGKLLANTHGMRFIAIRVGTFHGQSEPDCLRFCSTLLSPRDGVQLFGLAVDYEGPEKFIVTYGASGNNDGPHRSFLDISQAVEILGYAPQDNMMKYRDQFPE